MQPNLRFSGYAEVTGHIGTLPEEGKPPASQKENTTTTDPKASKSKPLKPFLNGQHCAPKGQWVVGWVEAVEVEVKGFGKGRLEPRQVASQP